MKRPLVSRRRFDKMEKMTRSGGVNVFQKVMTQVKNGALAPIYILYGTETHLMEQMLAHLKKYTLTGGHDDMNYVTFDLEQTPVEELIQEAETMPFLGEKRLIVGYNATFLTAVRRKEPVSHRLERLTDYAENPLASSVIVLTVHHDKLDERKKLVKQLKASGQAVRFSPLGPRELTAWIQRQATSYGVRIAPEAAERLVQHAGNDLRLLEKECAKLAIHAGEGGTVTTEDIALMTPRALEENIFKLVDHLGKKQTGEALAVFYDLLKKREEPIRILSLIARQFRIMLQVKELGGAGRTQKQIASALGLHPYAVKIALKQHSRFSEKALQRLLLETKRTDYAIKTGRQEKTLAVELYLLSINRWARA